MTTTKQATSLTVRRTVSAPRERVFRAWTDPAEMRKWLSPEALTTPEATVDLREGGRFRIVMAAPDGSRHVAVGVYREIRRPERLVFTWEWESGMADDRGETVVTVELHARGEQTEVVLTHAGLADAESVRKHEEGWTSSLVSLERRGL